MDNSKKNKERLLNILNEVISLVDSGKKEKALDLIGKTLKVKKTQRYFWLDKILKNEGEGEEEIEESFDTEERPNISDEELEFKERYVYNSETDKYIFLLKNRKPAVLENSLVKSILVAYSDFDKNPQTLSRLENEFSIPKKVIQEILGILGFTHGDIPLLKEELSDGDEDEIVNDLLVRKKFSVHQKFQKRDWLETQENARKWVQFVQGTLRPIKDLLSAWSPPKTDSVKTVPLKRSDETVLIGLSDLHFGLYTEKDDLFLSGKGWTINDTKNAVNDYCEKIIKRLHRRSNKFPKKAVICLVGDLLHTLTGQTDKGTVLQAHPIGEKQWAYAQDSLFLFVARLKGYFEEIEIKAVNGNHNSIGDFTLGKMLEVAFRDERHISFEITEKRFLAFNIDDNGFIMEHGASSHTKAKLPAHGTPRSNYIQSLFLSNKLVRNSKHKYFLVGDQHHLEHQEYNNFELIMFGTPNNGDRYADMSNLSSRPRQSCLIFTEEGLSELLHFYFD